MMEDSVITKEIKDLINVERVYSYEIEKGMIRKLARAIDDPNPLWQNEEYASKTRYGGIIAPPTFISILGTVDLALLLATVKCSLKAGVNGGFDIEYYQPIRPGDVITFRYKVTSVEEKKGKRGKLLVISTKGTWKNQRGEIVASIPRQDLIRL